MNPAYFTPDNIHEKARELQRRLQGAVGNRGRPFIPGEAALFVIDMQRYFVEPGCHAFLPSAPAIVPGVQRLISLFDRCARPVFFTRHLNTPENAGMLARWWSETISEKSAESEIIPDFDLTKGTVVKKCQYDAFHGTQLEADLKTNEVTQLVITGVMTHLCCETTTRSAFVKGFEAFFTIDGTATASEDFHVATLLNLAHGFASPVLVDDIARSFEEQS
jgi:bifunctional isochorismate lyase/aryl carrier protein